MWNEELCEVDRVVSMDTLMSQGAEFMKPVEILKSGQDLESRVLNVLKLLQASV